MTDRKKKKKTINLEIDTNNSKETISFHLKLNKQTNKETKDKLITEHCIRHCEEMKSHGILVVHFKHFNEKPGWIRIPFPILTHHFPRNASSSKLYMA